MEVIQRGTTVLGSTNGPGATQAASFVSALRRAGKYRDVRYQFVIPGAGTPNGVWTLEVSEDPRVEKDLLNGTYGGGSETAKWVTLALSGDIDVDKTAASSGVTLNAADITSDGSTVFEAVIRIQNPHSYLRWRWTRTSGTITLGFIYFSGRGS